MNLVLAHDYLIQMGGAERVVATMHRAFPKAPIYTSAVCRETLWEDFADADIRTTWLQHAPGIGHHTHFKKYLPLFSAAFRSFGTVDADCAWISSSTFAKFLRFTPRTRTVCYIHNPTRFLWQTEAYVDQEVANPILNRLVRILFPRLRAADAAAARRMDVLIANSHNVQRRIRNCYGRESLVIPPPVAVNRFRPSPDHDGSYLIVSRLIGYKNVDLAVRACTRTSRPLVVLGEGPQRATLERLAGPTVRILGRLSEKEVTSHFERCRAFIFPGHEDFGITPVEAMACGKPVVALRRGGALETILEDQTGVFFDEPDEDQLLAAMQRLETRTWDPAVIRRQAEQFSEEIFLKRTQEVLSRQ